MLVNLGCGDRYAPGWVNVDHAGSPHRRDLTLDLTGELPWGPRSVLHAYLGHVLEHLTLEQCAALLTRLRPLVKTEGQIMVVGPDVGIAKMMAARGELDVTLDSLKYGAGRWAGDEHQWLCGTETVMNLLYDTGWTDVVNVGITDVAVFWPVADRRPRWQLAVSARSGSDDEK